jgi:hypothetical protein
VRLGNAICDSADEALPAMHGAGSSRSQEMPTLRISAHRLTWYGVAAHGTFSPERVRAVEPNRPGRNPLQARP